MFSCDTMVVCAPYSMYGQNLFAKNSDRPTGEPQPLCFYAGGLYGRQKEELEKYAAYAEMPLL